MLLHAQGLERRGHRCDIYIEGVGDDKDAAGSVGRLFGLSFSAVKYGWNEIAPVDIAVATIWYSAAIVRDLPFPCHKIYFVQDYEAWFNPIGDVYLMAEGSYEHGLTPVTIGRWLRREMEMRFGLSAFHFDFGADLCVYRRRSDLQSELAICFLYQPEKPRRCSRLGIDALGIVKHLMPEVKVILYGSNEKGRVWFDHENRELLTIDACNALYNQCALGLCLSASNPSRVPFEMMAAGLPVVDLWRHTNLYDFPPQAVSLSRPNPESIAAAIVQLLKDAPRRKAMSEAGIRFMSARSLEAEIDQFSDALGCVIQGLSARSTNAAEVLYDQPPIDADFARESLPTSIRAKLKEPPNAFVNSFHPLLRRMIGSGVRVARRLLEYR
jgi:O-antigen biosynthesis protein